MTLAALFVDVDEVEKLYSFLLGGRQIVDASVKQLQGPVTDWKWSYTRGAPRMRRECSVEWKI